MLIFGWISIIRSSCILIGSLSILKEGLLLFINEVGFEYKFVIK